MAEKIPMVGLLQRDGKIVLKAIGIKSNLSFDQLIAMSVHKQDKKPE